MTEKRSRHETNPSEAARRRIASWLDAVMAREGLKATLKSLLENRTFTAGRRDALSSGDVSLHVDPVPGPVDERPLHLLTIRDGSAPDAKVVGEVEVELESLRDGRVLRGKTDHRGQVRFDELPEGEYRIALVSEVAAVARVHREGQSDLPLLGSRQDTGEAMAPAVPVPSGVAFEAPPVRAMSGPAKLGANAHEGTSQPPRDHSGSSDASGRRPDRRKTTRISITTPLLTTAAAILLIGALGLAYTINEQKEVIETIQAQAEQERQTRVKELEAVREELDSANAEIERVREDREIALQAERKKTAQINELTEQHTATRWELADERNVHDVLAQIHLERTLKKSGRTFGDWEKIRTAATRHIRPSVEGELTAEAVAILGEWDSQRIRLEHVPDKLEKASFLQVAVSPEGRLLAVGTEGTERGFTLWELPSVDSDSTSAKMLTPVEDWQDGRVLRGAPLAFGPGAKLAILKSNDRIEIWDVNEVTAMRLVETIEVFPATWIGFSPDGRFLAAVLNPSVVAKVKGSVVAQVEGPGEPQGSARPTSLGATANLWDLTERQRARYGEAEIQL